MSVNRKGFFIQFKASDLHAKDNKSDKRDEIPTP